MKTVTRTVWVDGNPIAVTDIQLKDLIASTDKPIALAPPKKAVWVLPCSLSPATYATVVFGEMTQDIKLALHFVDKEDALDERNYMNMFLRPQDRLTHEPIMHVV